MPVPAGALPEVFTSPLNPSSDICQAFQNLIAVREQLGILVSWMFTVDGKLSSEFNKELFKWVYGPLTSIGNTGNYEVTSVYPYASAHTVDYPGRVVFFLANHPSPATGCTLKLDALTATPLLNIFGAPLVADDIRVGQLVGAISTGSNYRMFTTISRVSVDQIEGNVEGDFGRSRLVGGRQRFVWEAAYRTADADLQSLPAASTVVAGGVTFAHGLAAKPLAFGVNLVNIATDQGYAVGDEIPLVSTISHNTNVDDEESPTISANASIIRLVIGDANNISIRVAHVTTGAQTEIDHSKWKARAWAIAP